MADWAFWLFRRKDNTELGDLRDRNRSVKYATKEGDTVTSDLATVLFAEVQSSFGASILTSIVYSLLGSDRVANSLPRLWDYPAGVGMQALSAAAPSRAFYAHRSPFRIGKCPMQYRAAFWM